MVPGVLKNEDSGVTESFQENLLEYPQYSRPEVWHDRHVPPILLSGHHANIARWTREKSLKITGQKRPDLIKIARSLGRLSSEDEAFLRKNS